MSDGILYFRSLEMDDVNRMYKWHNDPALYDTLVGSFRPVSRGNVEEWLRQKQAFTQQEINWAICLTANGEHIGNIYLRDIDWIARRGEVHIFLGDTGQRGRGHGRTAMRMMLDHAFKTLGLQRVYLFVLENNQVAIRLYEKCGFAVEGKLRRHAFKQGTYQDVLIMGICAGLPGELPS